MIYLGNMNNLKEDYCELPPGKQPALRVAAMPKDTNFKGDIFGGWILGQVDIAGSIDAMRIARGRVATVAVKEVVFKKPVYVGDLVSCYAECIAIGNTSITMDITVYAERVNNGKCVKVTEAKVVYVAVDENGIPRPVPKG